MNKRHAEEWAEQILSTEEVIKLQQNLEQEFLDYVVFNRTPYHKNRDFSKEFEEECEQTYDMTASEIIERFDDVLSPEQKEELKKHLNDEG